MVPRRVTRKLQNCRRMRVVRSSASYMTALMERMYRVHIAYGVDFLFCDKRATGRRIAELLGIKKEE